MDKRAINSVLEKWHSDSDYAIEILQDLQDHLLHLPSDVITYVADCLQVPVGRLYHIGSFFRAFSFEPRGKHIIQVCMGTACHVKGAANVLDAFTRELGVEVGETTADGLFTVEPVRCLGCCALAPVVAIGDDLHGEITPSRVKRLLKLYRKE